MAKYPEALVKKYGVEFLDYVESIRAKRPKTVIQHILKHGMITTEELKRDYGYSHAPRAARDVRELGIPLITVKVKDSNGRSIAAYEFGESSQTRNGVLNGRRAVSKKTKDELVEKYGATCGICSTKFPAPYLQVDHRVPYEIAGEVSEKSLDDYMLLCGACNRAKSWSCEHKCPNWTKEDAGVCTSCYWAHPEKYEHVATNRIRRLDVTWEGAEAELFDAIEGRCRTAKIPMSDYVKRVLKKHHDIEDS